MAKEDTEPTPLKGRAVFEPWDFESLAEGRARSSEFNDRRLAARRRLLGLGKAFVPRAKALGTSLEARSSLHHPHAFNGGAVRRLWTYITRAKGEKSKLRGVLGRDLAKDLDSAYRNAYLYLALEPTGFEVGLRIHQDAWYDGQNLAKRVAAEGHRPWLEILGQLDGYQLRLHDWKGEWRCGELDRDKLTVTAPFAGVITDLHTEVLTERAPVRGPATAPRFPSTASGQGARVNKARPPAS